MWRLIQILNWIPLLASVETAPFGELYKFDPKTGKMVAGSIPLHTPIYQTLLARLQTTFLLETSCQNDTYWVKREDPMKFTGLRQGFHNKILSCVNRLCPDLIQRLTFLK